MKKPSHVPSIRPRFRGTAIFAGAMLAITSLYLPASPADAVKAKQTKPTKLRTPPPPTTVKSPGPQVDPKRAALNKKLDEELGPLTGAPATIRETLVTKWGYPSYLPTVPGSLTGLSRQSLEYKTFGLMDSFTTYQVEIKETENTPTLKSIADTMQPPGFTRATDNFLGNGETIWFTSPEFNYLSVTPYPPILLKVHREPEFKVAGKKQVMSVFVRISEISERVVPFAVQSNSFASLTGPPANGTVYKQSFRFDPCGGQLFGVSGYRHPVSSFEESTALVQNFLDTLPGAFKAEPIQQSATGQNFFVTGEAKVSGSLDLITRFETNNGGSRSAQIFLPRDLNLCQQGYSFDY
jgi:hypothetical protein